MSDQKNHKHHKKPTEDLEQKCGEYLAGWQRAQADYQNLQKQTADERAKYLKMANEELIMEILPIYDNLCAAAEHIPESQRKEGWVVGVEHIKKQLEKVLEDNGVEKIIPRVGDEFDTRIHEAVEKSEEDDDKIKKVIKNGYKLSGQVIVAAKVAA